MTTEVGHHHHVSPEDLTSVEAHIADILDSIRPLPPTQLGITEAEGCVLAEDITASRPLPPFDNSAMDGYALIASDVAGASKDSPATLRVSGEVAAGDTGAYAVTPGSALIITTGAMLPGGADAVVPVEDTDGGVARVAIRTAVEPGHAVRFSGGDARQGEVLLRRGTRLGPMQIAVLAASGHARAEVYPRPRVVVVSTGNELVEPGHSLPPGKIWDSNSFMLTAAAREAGCLAFRHGPVPDDPLEMLPAIEDQLLRADLLVTSGGVSMGGRHDVVKDTLSRLGTITFRKVAMQPGMPQGFGTIGEDSTPDLHPARQPGQRLRVVPAVRAGRAGRPAGTAGPAAALGAREGDRPPALPAGTAVVPARGTEPPGRHGRPAVRAGLPPGRHARPGQRADRRARVGRAAERGRRRRGTVPAMSAELTHLDETGQARMVDVSGKEVTARTARASGRVLLSAEAVAALRSRQVPKGDALAVARIAGIQGAKKTPDLIPLCHPIGLHGVTVELTVTDEGVEITAVTRTADRTGVEMEALTSVSVAALALIDMVKAIDPAAVITDVRVDEKAGGKNGPWHRR